MHLQILETWRHHGAFSPPGPVPRLLGAKEINRRIRESLPQWMR